MSNAEFVYTAIEAIETNSRGREPFTESRYPYTYAYDYARSHPEAFGWDGLLSRAEVSRLLREQAIGTYQGTNAQEEWFEQEVCGPLADAYLREHGITRRRIGSKEAS